VVIGVRDLEDAVARYRKTYELPEPKRQTDTGFGAKLAWFEGTPVILAVPLDRVSWLGARVEQFGDGPAALILKASKTPGTGTNWFGTPVSWFDVTKLGWRLGVGQVPDLPK
jgi:hypothetical protein